ncbi:MAG TPA: hypothetical protein VJ890_27100 [Vineibacter sp.]|nr:hypothetical protein [Vineibacter sp.]
MPAGFGFWITIDGSLNEAVAHAPASAAKKTRKLPVPWSPQRYEEVILGLLRTLHGSAVGRAVMAQLSRPLMIRPYIWTPANAIAVSQAGQDATEKGAPIFCKDGDPYIEGTGKGSPVTIWITPANRLIPDASLLHEMVHAIRMMQGARTCYEYGGDFDREEEYIAILLTNIFMSELGRKMIRLDHSSQSWVPATSPWDQFRIDPFLITTFSMRHSSLAMDLGRAKDATFNPFNPKYAEHLRVGPN